MPDWIQVLIKLVVFTIMFALGLELSWERLQQVVRQPKLYFKPLLGTCFGIPLLGLIALKLPLTMSAPARIAIGLMAICPSAPMTLNRVRQSGGDRDIAAVLQISAALLAIVTVPWMADLYRSQLNITGWDIRSGEVARQVIQVQILPLISAVLFRKLRPHWANLWQPFANKIANFLLLLLILFILAKTGSDLVQFLIRDCIALVVMTVLAGVSFGLGSLLTIGDRVQQVTLALTVSMRNTGLSLLLASLFAPDQPIVKLAILSYALIVFILSTLILGFMKD